MKYTLLLNPKTAYCLVEAYYVVVSLGGRFSLSATHWSGSSLEVLISISDTLIVLDDAPPQSKGAKERCM